MKGNLQGPKVQNEITLRFEEGTYSYLASAQLLLSSKKATPNSPGI